MFPSTEHGNKDNIASSTPDAAKLSPFLSSFARNNIGEYVVVHTAQRTYTGRLLSVTEVCVILDTDSDALDMAVRVRIDSTRIEAVEVLPE